MRLLVPKEKDSAFATKLFEVILTNVEELTQENLQHPKKIVFMGNLGKEVLTFIREKGWNFEGFHLERTEGLINSIVFKYDAPLTVSNDPNQVIFEDETLHGKIINGIPGEGTVHKLISSYASPSFKMEKTVRPERRVSLTRK